MTVRAVAERAGVNERTVYRHFVNERGLRDAVMHRLEEEAGHRPRGAAARGRRRRCGPDLRARLLVPLEPRPPLDPTLTEAGQRRRNALLGAVAARTAGWPEADRVVAAAMFDVLWSVASYERLVVDWQLDRKQAIRGITWVIRLVEEAIRQGRRPS